MRTLSVLAGAAVLVVATVAVALAELPPGGTFTDDNGNVHEGHIEAIAAEGITRGCNPPFNDKYCPASPVTRGQMAAFLVRTLGLTDDGGTDWFGDDDSSIFESDINKLAMAGITRGCNPAEGNTKFCPNDFVTRGQMAAFLVRAYGYTDSGDGDYFSDDDGLVFEGDIDRLATAGVTKGCNPSEGNTRFCPFSFVRRDEMATFLGRAEGLTPMVPPPPSQPRIETVLTGLNYPVYATSPPGDDRLFVVEKSGYIRIVENDALLSGAFLDIHTLVSTGYEQGLLGMAFHPDYADNGLFYISYTDTSGDSQIVEYSVSGDPNRADVTSARSILEVDQFASNHNGGMILFDPDGYLLFGLGDGGGSGDPREHGQDKTTLLGSMLRIDIDGDDFPGDSSRNYAIPPDNPYVGTAGADEIWAIGLRNPWRFSVDETTDLLYIGDVGQAAWEEVDVAPVATPGLNYGWDWFEGNHCYETADGCDPSELTFPAVEYPHSYGCSVTGGYVYRGTELADLDGHYFYADFCRGELLSFKYVDGLVGAQRNWTSQLGTLGAVTSFAVDESDRLYIMNSSGSLMRLAPTP